MLPSIVDNVQAQTQLSTSGYIGAATFTLLVYDYLLTLETEVTAFWGVKISPATILFFVNRYSILLGNIPITMIHPTYQICTALDAYHILFIAGVQIVIAAMMILRTHGLYGRSPRILAVMVVSTTISITLFIFGTIHSSSLPSDQVGTVIALNVGCVRTITIAGSIGPILSWVAMSMFDCTIFVLTLYRTISRQRLVQARYLRYYPDSTSRAQGRELVALLIRDGSMYFAILTLSNIANILTFVLGGMLTRGRLNTFTNSLASVMISRLMLNLRLTLHRAHLKTSEEDHNGGRVRYIADQDLEAAISK
ncbi:hypothetical protein C8F01DRAFT_1301501 [Mycena amicta]|nr:hypothetical protein C8F01DRAFT_1301501 [Mycena amicta]